MLSKGKSVYIAVRGKKITIQPLWTACFGYVSVVFGYMDDPEKHWAIINEFSPLINNINRCISHPVVPG